MDLGDSYGKLMERFKSLKRIGTPQEDQETQITRTLGDTQRLSLQPNSIHKMD